MDCGFGGNSDVFGIGIRIGYYAQITAVWYSNYFYYSEAPTLRAVNNLFLLAVITAGFIYLCNAPQTYVVEAFLLLQIGKVVAVVGITDEAKYPTKYQSVSFERHLIRLLIFTLGAMFNLLFWWKGLDVMLATPCDGISKAGVGTYALYGWKVSLYGWMRIVMQIQSLFVAAFTAPVQIIDDMLGLWYILRTKRNRMLFIRAVTSGPDHCTIDSGLLKGFNQQECMPRASSDRLSREATKQQLSADANTHKPTIASTQRQRSSEKVMLEGIGEATNYLVSLLSILPGKAKSTHQKRTGTVCGGRIRYSVLVRERQKSTDTTPWLRCLYRSIAMLFNVPGYQLVNFSAFVSLISHEYDVIHWPRLFNRIHELNKSHGIPDWRYMTIASDLHLIQIPSQKPTIMWSFQATLQFLVIAILTIQVELTIIWNHMSNLNSLAPLGQLIPFIIGIGSLIKVLWGTARSCRSNDTDDSDRRIKPKDEYEKALAEYVGWKDNPREDKVRITRSATA